MASSQISPMNLDILARYAPMYVDAAILTLRIAAIGILGSLVLGLLVAAIRHYRIPVATQIGAAYVELSRNTPLLVQLFFIYFGLPRVGIKWSGETCAIVGLIFLGGAYMAEALRSGLDSIATIQWESASALGLTRTQTLRHVALPQAIATSVPPLAANVIFLIKETSVVSVVALPDLVYVAKDLIGMSYNTSEALILLVVAYLVILLPVSIAARLVEKRRCAVADLGINVIFEGRNLVRILEGLGVTVGISALSVVLSLILGVFVGLGMRSRWRALRWLMQLYLEFVRIMPQLVLLFVAYFGLTRVAGINLDGITASVLVFTLWGGAEMGDLVRGALIAIPRHQYESAYALGLSPKQTMRRVILPQTLRRLAPPAVNLITRMVKTTSLVVLIGVVEVLKVGQQIIDANRFNYPTASLWIYGLIFALYFLICWPISLLSRHMEKTWQN